MACQRGNIKAIPIVGITGSGMTDSAEIVVETQKFFIRLNEGRRHLA